MSVQAEQLKNLPVLAMVQRGRHLAMAALSIAVIWGLSGHFGPLDFEAIGASISAFSASTWLAAAVFTAISFAAISRYDALVTGFLGHPIPARTAMATGWRATALSQVTGFGLFVGTFSRWRILSRTGVISLKDSAAITALICSVFLTGWAVVTCLVLLAAPALIPGAKTFALAGCLIALGVFFTLAMPPSFLSRRLPSCRFALDTVLFAFIDTVAAASVVYLFLPDDYTPFLTLYAAFLMAYATGMLSNLPGGVGAFELCLLTLLAPADPAPLIAALVAYRLIYYMAPALFALPALANPLRWTAASPEFAKSSMPAGLAKAAVPETTLTAHGQLSLVTNNAKTMGVLSAETNNCQIILGQSFGTDRGIPLIEMMRRQATTQRQSSCIYKCSASLAAALRGSGYAVLRIGQEAIIDPSTFSLESRKFRQLRRKLRAVEKAGIDIAPNHFDWDWLADIDRDWQARNGGAKGFSMGVFDPALLRRQLILTATLAGQPIAFVSFHIGQTGWALDLIRSGSNCPDGTIHALIHEAIKQARAREITSVSLAAAPFSGLDQNCGVASRIMARLYNGSPSFKGLYQFKQSFSPQWRPCYIAANSWPGLIMSAIELRQLIHTDETVWDAPESELHNHYANYEIASDKQACHVEI